MGRSTKTNRMIGAASATAPMALIVAALLPGHALGQTAPAAAGQTTPVSSQSGAVGQGDIVVTAQRRSENIQDVPITIEAFSGDSLKKLGVEAAADLGKIATNVVVSCRKAPATSPRSPSAGSG
jgi:iron complex outermembrane receptor protein